ncbi:hypothetical protein PEPS_11870 [Persicobacter psychrovividus]|uniref:Yip1 domain-containing protein n=2 Tax=Persicobacter psychrovividus TaxID=387638 RepID=A0ABN6LBW8_9BACT|nr:hypothetical protein PEPS_11870 [Persicobacter psychrovividus]
MVKMTDEELSEVIKNREKYAALYVEAAAQEIKDRKERPKPQIKEGEGIQVTNQTDGSKKIVLNEEQISKLIKDKKLQPVPSLYSKVSIALTSIFITPLLGIILFSSNLRRTGDTKGINLTWILVIGYIVISTLIGALMPESAAIDFKALQSADASALLPLLPIIVVNLVINIAFAFLIITYAWDKIIGKNRRYHKRQAIGTVIIYILILVVLSQFSGLF